MASSVSEWLRRVASTTKASLKAAQDSVQQARTAGTGNVHREEDFVSIQAKARNHPDAIVPWSVRAAAEWSWRLLIIAFATSVLIYIMYQMQIIVVPVLVAVLIAVLLDPIAEWQRRVLRFPRALAALVTLLGTLAAISALLVFSGQAIVDGFSELADSAVAGFNSLLAWLSDGPLKINQHQIQQAQQELVAKVQENSSLLASGVLSFTSSLGQIVSGALISLFCLFFFLMEGRNIWLWCVRLLPVTARERTHEAAIRGWLSLRGYARTQILVAFVDGVGIGIGAWLLGVPLYLPLGVLVFLGSFVPIVGALVTGTIAVLVALVSHGPTTALFMLLVVLAVQQIEGNVLQPFLMGHAVALHPVAVLLAVAGATYLAGIVGALFIVPFVAFINTVVLYFHGRDKFPELASDSARPGGPPGIFGQQMLAEDADDIREERDVPVLAKDEPELVDAIVPPEVGEAATQEASAESAEEK